MDKLSAPLKLLVLVSYLTASFLFYRAGFIQGQQNPFAPSLLSAISGNK